MNLKKIKCLIVDFDETLYSNGDWTEEILAYKKYVAENNLVPEIADIDGKMEYLRKTYPGFHIIKFVFAYLHDNGIDDSHFRNFVENCVCNIIGENTVFINSKIIEELARYYKIYIVSDSATKYLEHYLDYGKIDKNLFQGIYSNAYDDETYSKIPALKRVLDETGLKPNEIIMIGDSENSDIKPAKLLGFQTKHINSVYETEQVLQDFINLKSSKSI